MSNVINFPVCQNIKGRHVTVVGPSRPSKRSLTPCLTETGGGLSNGSPVTRPALHAKRRSKRDGRSRWCRTRGMCGQLAREAGGGAA